jgi:hypothetical protein
MLKKIGLLVTVAVIMACVAVPRVKACETFTVGYWKNHPNWPVGGMFLGVVWYDQKQLMKILNTQPRGDAVITLKHQLIAATLSWYAGQPPSELWSLIQQANAWLANPTDRATAITIANQIDTILELYDID